MKHLGSAITGALNQAPRGASSTGRQPGGTGSAVAETASERLLASAPEATEAALEALLPPPLASWLRWTTLDLGTVNHVTARRHLEALKPQVAALSSREISVALLAHERACRPAPRELIVRELAAIKLLTRPRPEAGDDLAAQIALYTRRLGEYPGDIAMHVLRTQGSVSTWWPSWQELAERLDWRCKRRRDRLEGLRRLSEARP